ncbi:MAG: hypothetical protein WBX27_02235 [Specibacter sp.]
MGRTTSRELVAVRRRVEAWRRGGGGRGTRIPEELWNEAVEVARVAGVYATARALKFNYEGLKERAGQAGDKQSGNLSRFVALELPPVNGGAKVVVDLVGRDGEQVRIEVSGASGMEVVALAQAFWKRRS